MNDPFRSFKQQPWLPLMKVAGLTTLIAMAIEGGLLFALLSSPALERTVSLLLSGILGVILSVSASVGVGALGVYLCERYAREVYLNNASLWALALCLIVGIGLKSLIPFPQLLVSFSMDVAIAIVVGVFWKGRPHWRRFW